MLQHVSEFPDLSWLDDIPLYVKPHLVYLFIHVSFDGHLDCFHYWAIISSTAMNMVVRIALQHPPFCFFGIYSEVELLDHSVILFLIF